MTKKARRGDTAKSKLPVQVEPAGRATRRRQQKPSALALKALALFETGQVDTVTAAAKVLGASREGLSRALNRDAVKKHIAASARLDLQLGVGYAVRAKLRLMREAESQRLQSDVASEVMALGAGIQMPRPGTSVEIHNSQTNVAPGYVIVLRGKTDSPRPSIAHDRCGVIDVEAEPNPASAGHDADRQQR